jgi:hypothetical protein
MIYSYTEPPADNALGWNFGADEVALHREESSHDILVAYTFLEVRDHRGFRKRELHVIGVQDVGDAIVSGSARESSTRLISIELFTDGDTPSSSQACCSSRSCLRQRLTAHQVQDGYPRSCEKVVIIHDDNVRTLTKDHPRSARTDGRSYEGWVMTVRQPTSVMSLYWLKW